MLKSPAYGALGLSARRVIERLEIKLIFEGVLAREANTPKTALRMVRAEILETPFRR